MNLCCYFMETGRIGLILSINLPIANVAMKFALRYPTHVRALILNGGNYDATGVKRSVQFPIEVGYRLCCFFFTLFIGGPTKHGNARFDGERAPFNT